MASDEADLVARAKAQDMEAFEALVTDVAPRVWRLACRMVGPGDAPDIVQQTFLAAWQALERFQSGRAFGSWVMGIASHRCLNWLRSRRRARQESMEGVAWRMADSGEAPDQRFERQEEAAALAAAIATLPDTSAAIIMLHYTEELTCAQIADSLGMQESAVKVALFRARGKLRDRLERR